MLQPILVSIRFGNGTQYCPTIETAEEVHTKIISNRTQEMVKIHKNEDDNENNDDDDVERRKSRTKIARHCSFGVYELCCIGFNSMFNWFFAIWTVFKYGFPISRSCRFTRHAKTWMHSRRKIDKSARARTQRSEDDENERKKNLIKSSFQLCIYFAVYLISFLHPFIHFTRFPFQIETHHFDSNFSSGFVFFFLFTNAKHDDEIITMRERARKKRNSISIGKIEMLEL